MQVTAPIALSPVDTGGLATDQFGNNVAGTAAAAPSPVVPPPVAPPTSGTTGATPTTGAPPSPLQLQSVPQAGVQNVSGTGTLSLPQNNASVTSVQAPNAAADTAAYTAQVQQSLAPQFQQSQQQLAAQQAAMGTLSSGQGNQGLQDLYSQQNATVAGLVAPMIQQGNAEQYGANTTNAGAANSYQQMLQQQVYGAGQNQLNNNLQAQEFNAGAANNAQLATLGYANSDYQQQMSELAGLQSQGLGGTLGTTNQGMNNQLNSYTQGYQNLLPYLQQTGVGQGYGTPGQTSTGTTPQLNYNGSGLTGTTYGPDGGTDYTAGPGVVAQSPNEAAAGAGGDNSAGYGDYG